VALPEPRLRESRRAVRRRLIGIERQAIVANEDWLRLLAKAGNLLPGIHVHHFTWIDKGKALARIND
jgi:hypothetical protein